MRATSNGWGATITTGANKVQPAPEAATEAPRPKRKSARRAAPPAAAETPAVSAAAAGPIATSAAVSGDAARTQLAMELSGPAAFAVFRMTNPYRVVIDLDNVEFRLPDQAGRQPRGLITSFRYGLFAAGKARIVIDTAGPVRIDAARMKMQPGSTAARFEIDFLPTTATELAAAELAAAAQTANSNQPANSNQTVSLNQTGEPKPLEAAPAPAQSRAKPVILLDPGHGGIDPGAQGAHGYEKDVVLAVAREIRRALLASRRYDVVMTRSTDVFISLDQRVKLSRQHQADLFVSVHADSLSQKGLAQNIRGATVYTLAEKATDDRARLLAEKENAADVLAGLNVSSGPNDDQVRNILFDLVRRESANFANDFRGLLLKQLRPRLALAKEPTRSAPFKVLRQPGSPAVLIELGYMSNAEDEKLMGTPAWQRNVGDAVAKAVDDFFQRRPRP